MSLRSLARRSYALRAVDSLIGNIFDMKDNKHYFLCTINGLQGNMQSTKNHGRQGTIGRQMAHLLSTLYDRSQSSFTLADAGAITGLSPNSTSTLLHKAVKRGLVSRLKPGVFTIVPPELGSSAEYAGNPYLTAIKLAITAPCFISHASAMEIHRMVTQPQLVVFASSSKRIRSRKLHGTEFRFVFIKPDQYFGTVKYWVTKQESVQVSDLERTVIDGLRQPKYCGGITEVAKGLWMRHSEMQTAKLVDYALRLRIGAVTRRLGYLLELYQLATEEELTRLRKSLTATYLPLDPMLPKEGRHFRRWRIQLNIMPEELEIVRTT
jgi:predicted transcriptional regulator of viral defense system